MLFFESKIDIVCFFIADLGQVQIAVAQLLEEYEVFGHNNVKLGLSVFWTIVVVNCALIIMSLVGFIHAYYELIHRCAK